VGARNFNIVFNFFTVEVLASNLAFMDRNVMRKSKILIEFFVSLTVRNCIPCRYTTVDSHYGIISLVVIFD